LRGAPFVKFVSSDFSSEIPLTSRKRQWRPLVPKNFASAELFSTGFAAKNRRQPYSTISRRAADARKAERVVVIAPKAKCITLVIPGPRSGTRNPERQH
jgi:hypothetical protein